LESQEKNISYQTRPVTGIVVIHTNIPGSITDKLVVAYIGASGFVRPSLDGNIRENILYSTNLSYQTNYAFMW
jgi:hypothetical protein